MSSETTGADLGYLSIADANRRIADGSLTLHR